MFEVCLQYDPSVLNGVEQLSLMSAVNAISIDLRTHLETRLLWLEKILNLAKREVSWPNTAADFQGPVYRVLASGPCDARSAA